MKLDVTLANLLGNALLSSAYLALILYAVIEVLDGVVIIALRLGPFHLFSVVRRHGAVLRHRMHQSSPGEQTLVPETLQELSTSIEELTVTAEELQQQNDELAATRGLVEADRRHFQELFESAPDGYLVTDMRGIIQEANSNAAKLLHRRQDFLVGKPIFIYIAKEEHASLYEKLARLERGEALLNWEAVMQPRDGAAFHAALTVSAVRDLSATDQRPVGLRWLIRDVTKRWTAEQQIETQLTRISVLCDINLAITSTLDLQTILDVLLDRLTLFFPYPIAATVRLITPETGKLEHVICRGIDEAAWQAHAPLFPPPRTQEALRTEVPSWPAMFRPIRAVIGPTFMSATV